MDEISKTAAEAVAAAGTNRIKEIFSKWKQDTLSTNSLRSWSVFCSKTKFSFPKVTEAPQRLKTNLTYFQTNYIVVFGLIVLYSIISNPWFLLALGVVGGGWAYVFHVRKEPIFLGSHEVTDREKMVVLGVVTIITFWFASVSNTIFWLIGATLTVVNGHALFFTPIEDEIDFNTSFGEQRV